MTESFRAWKVGLPYYLPLLAAGAAMIGLGFAWGAIWVALGVVLLGAGVFTLNFFRDPHRAISLDPAAVVSPADGLVVAIENFDNHDHYEGPCVRISIFLNVFNVHVNRIPFDGEVTRVQYKPGQFKNAMKPETSQINESNAVHLQTSRGSMTVRQISGAVARRIVCIVKPGDHLPKGARLGMIKFGSRTELYLPAGADIHVTLREKVRGGSSIVAYLREQ
ncbi:MAG: phosphatidylserine decarboxylase proenzyme [Candidatus Hydrogenedentota bacterium]